MIKHPTHAEVITTVVFTVIMVTFTAIGAVTVMAWMLG
jgi:hypothetical protein